MTLAPALLAPQFVPRIWGARSLAPLFDAPPGSEPIGEVWLTGDRCAFAGGPLAGRTIGEAWPSLSADWTGTRLRNLPRIPLLVKFIFPEDRLSVQVHPDDTYAREHESAAGGVGKTEMWYAVAARAGARLRLGMQPGVTLDAFRRAISGGTAEESLRALDVRPGDAFFVPAGTAHTIGPGMVLCEIQQNSDITYRVFDYNRVGSNGQPRPLHVRQALEVLRFAEPGERVQPLSVRSGSLLQTYLVACRYFATEVWDFSGAVTGTTDTGCFELIIVLSGQGRIEWDTQTAAYHPAQLWLLPAALSEYRVVPDFATKLLRTYVPDLRKLATHLAARQVSESDRARLIHA